MKAGAISRSFTEWPLHTADPAAVTATPRFHHVEAAGLHWLYADQAAAADFVYVGLDYPHESRGMDGETIAFPLLDAVTIELHGPWKTSAEELRDATAIDITDRYSSRGVIALSVEETTPAPGYSPREEYTELVHLDDDWVVGRYDRIEILAQQIANHRSQRVYYYVQTRGGAKRDWKDPIANSAR